MLEKNKKIKQLLDDVVYELSNPKKFYELMNSVPTTEHIVDSEYCGYEPKSEGLTALQILLLDNYDNFELLEFLELIKNNPDFDEYILCIYFGVYKNMYHRVFAGQKSLYLIKDEQKKYKKKKAKLKKLIKSLDSFYNVMIKNKVNAKTIGMFFDNFTMEVYLIFVLFNNPEHISETLYRFLKNGGYYISSYIYFLIKENEISDDCISKIVKCVFDNNILEILVISQNVSREDLNLILNKTTDKDLVKLVKNHPNYESELSIFIDKLFNV